MKGIGTDLTKLSRFEKLHLNERFIDRILTPLEKEDFFSINPESKQKFVAKRFAGKEAFSKAIGEGIGANLSFQDIEIRNNEKGAPRIKCLLGKFENTPCFISFSDEKMGDETLIIAVVLVC